MATKEQIAMAQRVLHRIEHPEESISVSGMTIDEALKWELWSREILAE